MILKYNIIGLLDEDKQGITQSLKCKCSGFINEDYSFIITDNCIKHKHIKKINYKS